MDSLLELIKLSINSCELINNISKKYNITNNDIEEILGFRDECLSNLKLRLINTNDNFIVNNIIKLENLIKKQKYAIVDFKDRYFKSMEIHKIINELQIYLHKQYVIVNNKDDIFHCLTNILLIEFLNVNQ
ncbi:hypothetical protein MYSEV_300 [Mythimna separata entomopoxvirus 'L']|uniref:Uncharacterized protein n=1 Tax=Mythimna separata entomopoxvirus 'L' TaxID=1293572 RepID=A0A916NYS0_9POXV|nr:hypothetical protein MYSEV_300 [Mythimna separata entomopoxvirus 'L']CCU56498.1 hypothetical protein MYSEV_300 [Mythimna separata entomopoxvirus 'L']